MHAVMSDASRAGHRHEHRGCCLHRCRGGLGGFFFADRFGVGKPGDGPGFPFRTRSRPGPPWQAVRPPRRQPGGPRRRRALFQSRQSSRQPATTAVSSAAALTQPEIMGPSGVPIPSQNYVDKVVEYYVRPGGDPTAAPLPQVIFTPEGLYPITRREEPSVEHVGEPGDRDPVRR